MENEKSFVEACNKLTDLIADCNKKLTNNNTSQPPAPPAPPAPPKKPTDMEKTASLIEAGTRVELEKQGKNPDEERSTVVEVFQQPTYQQQGETSSKFAADIQAGTEKILQDRRDRAIAKILREDMDTPIQVTVPL